VKIKEIRFWGKIGFVTAMRLKKSDFGEKSDLLPLIKGEINNLGSQ